MILAIYLEFKHLCFLLFQADLIRRFFFLARGIGG